MTYKNKGKEIKSENTKLLSEQVQYLVNFKETYTSLNKSLFCEKEENNCSKIEINRAIPSLRYLVK